ncbi:MAG: methyltransferase domain-containing protein, partial [Nitrososphaeraceae archaeon]|nr:methyltransferase domain-containing protein [Nitrososphaeraceae archaeon]
MSEIWDRVYSKNSFFFGEEPSSFAILCYEDLSKYGCTKLLELGCGQGRDTIFFALKGLDVHAIDSSKVAIKNLNERTRRENVS